MFTILNTKQARLSITNPVIFSLTFYMTNMFSGDAADAVPGQGATSGDVQSAALIGTFSLPGIQDHPLKSLLRSMLCLTLFMEYFSH